jgi:predicted GIY-YIG superfamily endonuclease
MPDYSQGKIYKIIDDCEGDIYIGSTTQTLRNRFKSHHIFSDYGKERENCRIVLIEDYPCNTKQELEERERHFIQNCDCINKVKYKWRREGDFIILPNIFH